MGGVRKTTLPHIIYNDEEVKKKFQIRGWVCVSGPFHPEAITRQILESISRRSFYSQSIPTEWALGRCPSCLGPGSGLDDIIAAVISQANMVTNSKNWVVDSGATRHICANKDAFTSYTPVGDDEKVIYLGDSDTAQVLGKGKVMLKLTLGKTLALNNVMHVPNIRANLVSVALLGKVGVKVSFEFDKIIMTKDNIFVGKEFCNQGLFVLSISEVMKENASSSAYLVDSYDIWHARLGHVSSGYIKKMQTLGLINNIDYSGLSKC